MERWLAYVEDAEAQLATVKPTGGLPETAQTHLDDFHVLKAEVVGRFCHFGVSCPNEPSRRTFS